VHTWPESRFAAFDVFMCGDTDPGACVNIMREAFLAERVEVKEILRGEVNG
jgi:S-adenosylmethionine decarboxylase